MSHLSNQKGIAHLILIIILLAGLALGVYLVTQTTNLRPKAAVSNPINFETSMFLGGNRDQSVAVGREFQVPVYVRSDKELANLFASKIKFDPLALELVSVNFGKQSTPTPIPTTTPIPSSPPNPLSPIEIISVQVHCGNYKNGATPDQLCVSKGFQGAATGTAAKGYGWRQCAGASIGNCSGLDCTINKYDCTNSPGYWGSQNPQYDNTPYPKAYLKEGTATTVFKPTDIGFDCVNYNPGYNLKIACISKPSPPTAVPVSSTSPVSCIQKTTRACAPTTRVSAPTECKDFPTPCDVPSGWIVVGGNQSFIERIINQTSPQEANNTGLIHLVGAVPNGYQTLAGQPSGVMATLTFKTKKSVVTEIAFDNTSEEATAIFSALTNKNILKPENTSDLRVNIGSISDSGFYMKVGTMTPKTGGIYDVTLSWAKVDGVSKYKLMRKTSTNEATYGSSNFLIIEGLSTVVTLSDQYQYNFKVEACTSTFGFPICIESNEVTVNPGNNAPTGVKGDINNDGKIGLADLSAFQTKCFKYFGNPAKEAPVCNINGDDIINTIDFSMIRSLIYPTTTSTTQSR